MKIIGLCGGSGSGKGTVCELFSKFGIPSIDTDALYRDMTTSDSPCLGALAEEFGDVVVLNGCTLNRAVLRDIVFATADADKNRAKLNEITHKYILDAVREIIRENSKKGIAATIVDAPLLFESGFNKECDLIFGVLADEEIRIDRIVKRDGLSREDAYKRISTQINNDDLAKKCDDVITNNGDLNLLSSEVKKVYKKHFCEEK